MRLTLALLGWTLDWSLEPTAEVEVEVEDDGGRDLGYTTATPVGYFAALEVPDFVPGTDRNNGWGDEGNRL